MPIYEFHCNDCNAEFESLVRMSDPSAVCPVCGSKNVQKKMSVCAFKAGDGPGNFVGTGKRASSGCSGCSSSNCSSCGG
ncbi:MAG: zinc ribbon domain-containing protein [Deltaproteobacteria bacterium]|nr:zinc ribbon domain-containing protein [Deltaproteobacteria bacterium]